MAFSVNTNSGAAVALQNLANTQRDLTQVQGRINTGLRVSSAKDDSASFSIAQGLRGDVAGLSAVQTSLNRAKSSLDVAVQAGESISDLLNKAREITVAASDAGIDSATRTALNNDFKSIVSQVDSVVSQAEFNGTNLIKASPDSISAITAVKQNSTVDRISVAGADLTTTGTQATLTKAAGAITVAATTSLADLINAGGTDAAAIAKETDGLANVVLNDDGTITATSGATSGTAAGGVTFTTGSTTLSIAVGGKTFNATLSANGAASTAYTLKLSDFTSTTGTTITTTAAVSKSINSIDLTKQVDRASAVAAIDNFKSNVNATLASFGSSSRQIDIQQAFATKLTDAINSGIGNLVDADLAKESARLQSLQVKQQLGLQALSIANQAPQSVVSLFR